jgi:hypothetical protein
MRTPRVRRSLALSTLPLALLTAQGPTAPAAQILGAWRGTSTCVDPQVDRACHDEEVIYVVDSAAGPRGPVSMRADKVVQGVRQPMGAFRLTYDSSTASWLAEFTTARFRARWTFEVRDSAMTGRLSELPSQRLVRRIAARRLPVR